MSAVANLAGIATCLLASLTVILVAGLQGWRSGLAVGCAVTGSYIVGWVVGGVDERRRAPKRGVDP